MSALTPQQIEDQIYITVYRAVYQLWKDGRLAMGPKDTIENTLGHYIPLVKDAIMEEMTAKGK